MRRCSSSGWLVHALCVLACRLDRGNDARISAEVVAADFGFPSIIGLIELTEYALFMSTFFVAPIFCAQRAVRVDIVMARIDPASAQWVECGVLATIMLISLITGIVGASHGASARERTCCQGLDLPAMVARLDHPLTSLAMLLQALELLVTLYPRLPSSHSDRGDPGHPTDELL